jgi:hypothetical protein
MARALLLAAALALSRAADAPTPSSWRGSYKGTVSQSFGTADPSNPKSYECVPHEESKGGALSATNVDAKIDASSLSLGGYKASSTVVGNSQYGMDGRSATTYQWASFAGSDSTPGILKLRTASGSIVWCVCGEGRGGGRGEKGDGCCTGTQEHTHTSTHTLSPHPRTAPPHLPAASGPSTRAAS